MKRLMLRHMRSYLFSHKVWEEQKYITRVIYFSAWI